MNGDLSFTVDEQAALVRVTGRGMWSAERTATHFNTLDKALRRMRQQRGGAAARRRGGRRAVPSKSSRSP